MEWSHLPTVSQAGFGAKSAFSWKLYNLAGFQSVSTDFNYEFWKSCHVLVHQLLKTPFKATFGEFLFSDFSIPFLLHIGKLRRENYRFAMVWRGHNGNSKEICSFRKKYSTCEVEEVGRVGAVRLLQLKKSIFGGHCEVGIRILKWRIADLLGPTTKNHKQTRNVWNWSFYVPTREMPVLDFSPPVRSVLLPAL